MFHTGGSRARSVLLAAGLIAAASGLRPLQPPATTEQLQLNSSDSLITTDALVTTDGLVTNDAFIASAGLMPNDGFVNGDNLVTSDSFVTSDALATSDSSPAARQQFQPNNSASAARGRTAARRPLQGRRINQVESWGAGAWQAAAVAGARPWEHAPEPLGALAPRLSPPALAAWPPHALQPHSLAQRPHRTKLAKKLTSNRSNGVGEDSDVSKVLQKLKAAKKKTKASSSGSKGAAEEPGPSARKGGRAAHSKSTTAAPDGEEDVVLAPGGASKRKDAKGADDDELTIAPLEEPPAKNKEPEPAPSKLLMDEAAWKPPQAQAQAQGPCPTMMQIPPWMMVPPAWWSHGGLPQGGLPQGGPPQGGLHFGARPLPGRDDPEGWGGSNAPQSRPAQGPPPRMGNWPMMPPQGMPLQQMPLPRMMPRLGALQPRPGAQQPQEWMPPPLVAGPGGPSPQLAGNESGSAPGGTGLPAGLLAGLLQLSAGKVGHDQESWLRMLQRSATAEGCPPPLLVQR